MAEIIVNDKASMALICQYMVYRTCQKWHVKIFSGSKVSVLILLAPFVNVIESNVFACSTIIETKIFISKN